VGSPGAAHLVGKTQINRVDWALGFCGGWLGVLILASLSTSRSAP